MRATVRLLFVSPLLLCVSLSACAFDVVPLGEDEADAFRVGQGPGTRHLAEALEGGGDLTLRDLFDQADNCLLYTSRCV